MLGSVQLQFINSSALKMQRRLIATVLR